MGYHALQFVPVELLNASPCYSHRRILDGEPRREGVDVELVLHDVDRRNRHPGCDGHLLHHVDVLALMWIPRGRVDLDGSHHLRHRRAARRQTGNLDETGKSAAEKRAARHVEQGIRLPEPGGRKPFRPRLPHVNQGACEEKIQDCDDAHDSQDEQNDQATSGAPRFLLVFEEVHGHGLNSSA